jgi:hypothetical protein
MDHMLLSLKDHLWLQGMIQAIGRVLHMIKFEQRMNILLSAASRLIGGAAEKGGCSFCSMHWPPRAGAALPKCSCLPKRHGGHV